MKKDIKEPKVKNVSYYVGSKIFDKKFIFLPESIKDENLTYIKELNTKGILHS